jgi:hypothetical protein
VVEESSSYANEGTAAHELANVALEQNIDPAIHLGHFVDIRAKDNRIRQSGVVPDGKYIWPINDEMVDAVTIYVDHVRGLVEAAGALAVIDVEQRLDMRHLHPGIFGTGDAVVYDIEGEHLHVCDFKYGKGHIVEVKRNPQLGLYGAGAARRYAKHRLKKITLHVVQPRTQGEPIKSWETDLLELMEFEDDISRYAAATDDPDAPLIAGDWCKDAFCPIRATCETRRRSLSEAAFAEFDDVTGDMKLPTVHELSPEQRGKILRYAGQLAALAKDVQEYEHAKALAGDPPEGYKLVANRAVRKWADPAAAAAKLKEHGLTDTDLFVQPEPKQRSAPQVETHIGKAKFALLVKKIEEKDDGAKLVVKKSSGVDLVLLDDPRPAVAADALSEFSDVTLIEN